MIFLRVLLISFIAVFWGPPEAQASDDPNLLMLNAIELYEDGIATSGDKRQRLLSEVAAILRRIESDYPNSIPAKFIKNDLQIGSIDMEVLATAMDRHPERADTGWLAKMVPEGRISNGYTHGQFPSWGQRTHPGVDIGGGCDLDVHSPIAGEVIKIVTSGDRDFDAVGNALVIDHGMINSKPTYTAYFHFAKQPSVSLGPVASGALLGQTGKTGAARGCHLHFEVRHFEGIRNLYNPDFNWRNIYGSGDQSKTEKFEADWSNPIEWLSKTTLSNATKCSAVGTPLTSSEVMHSFGGKTITIVGDDTTVEPLRYHVGSLTQEGRFTSYQTELDGAFVAAPNKARALDGKFCVLNKHGEFCSTVEKCASGDVLFVLRQISGEVSYVESIDSGAMRSTETEINIERLRRDPKSLQSRLTSLGYDVGVVDGYPGPQTRQGLMEFQVAHCLPPTGQPDVVTATALVEAIRSRYPCPEAGLPPGIAANTPLSDGIYVDNPALCNVESVPFETVHLQQRIVLGSSITWGQEGGCQIKRTDIRDGITLFRGTCSEGNTSSETAWRFDILSNEAFIDLDMPTAMPRDASPRRFAKCSNQSALHNAWQGWFTATKPGEATGERRARTLRKWSFDVGLEAAHKGDYVAAKAEWEPLAENGDARAQRHLGVMYARGLGVKQSFSEAYRLYKAAADQGNIDAQVNLGFLYQHGQGVAKNYDEAMRRYLIASEKGNALAQNNIGWMYNHGQGVAQDYVEAVRWYRISATSGNERGQIHLASMYQHGNGVEQDHRKAYIWYFVASMDGADLAHGNLQSLRAHMTPAGISDAEKRAELCVSSGYETC